MSEQITDFSQDLKAWKAVPELTDIHAALMQISEMAFNARFCIYEQRITDLSRYLEQLRQTAVFSCNVFDDHEEQALGESIWPTTSKSGSN
jgi:hypothetical protein